MHQTARFRASLFSAGMLLGRALSCLSHISAPHVQLLQLAPTMPHTFDLDIACSTKEKLSYSVCIVNALCMSPNREYRCADFFTIVPTAITTQQVQVVDQATHPPMHDSPMASGRWAGPDAPLGFRI